MPWAFRSGRGNQTFVSLMDDAREGLLVVESGLSGPAYLIYTSKPFYPSQNSIEMRGSVLLGTSDGIAGFEINRSNLGSLWLPILPQPRLCFTQSPGSPENRASHWRPTSQIRCSRPPGTSRSTPSSTPGESSNPTGWRLAVNGCSVHCYGSGMSNDMTDGMKLYRRDADGGMRVVDTFTPCELEEVGTLQEQREHWYPQR